MTESDLPDELKKLVHVRVWSGFFSFDDVLEAVLEGIDEGGFSEEELDLGQADVEPYILSEFAAKAEAAKNWPAQTECDKLADAFEKLTKSGIISLEYAGYDQSDGWTEYHEFVANFSLTNVRGGCFYHYQDLERAVDGEGLHLTFGAPSGEDADGIAVAKEVVQVLQQFGLKPTWNETIKERIFCQSIGNADSWAFYVNV
ncbi:MAG TPA: hypothetical protein V6C76_14225 [Drouetiella sp.]